MLETWQCFKSGKYAQYNFMLQPRRRYFILFYFIFYFFPNL